MSSISAPRPDFRLAFVDDAVRLVRSSRFCEEVPLAAADLVARLRAFGRERTSARARLTVLLPAGTLWEAALLLPRWNPAARRRAARAAAADALGLPAGAVAVAIGRQRADGSYPVAAIEAGRLAETRGFLGTLGLTPDRIAGVGSAVGFRGRPLALPLLPPLFPRFPTLPSVGELKLPAGVFAPLQRPLPTQPMLLGAGGLVAIAALGFALMPGEPPAAPAASPAALSAPAIHSAPVNSAPTESAAPRTAAVIPAPRHRPAGLQHLALAPEAVAPKVRMAPAAPRPMALATAAPDQVRVTMGTRNLPLTPLAPLPAARARDAGPEVAELGNAAVTLTDAIQPRHRPRDPIVERIGAVLATPAEADTVRPRWRPVSAMSVAAPVPPPGAAAAATPAATSVPAFARPAPRPGVPSIAAAVAVAAAPSASGPRPRQLAPRPAALTEDTAAFVSAGRPAPRHATASAQPVRVASLTPARDITLPSAPVGSAVKAAVATATAAPARAPAATQIRPQPMAAPVAKAPAKPQRVAAVRPSAAVAVPARSMPLAPVAKPTHAAKPAAKAIAAAKPVKPQPVAKAPAPTRTTTRQAKVERTTERVGLSRREVSLIGVFGDTDGRYALVRTDRGKVTRVRPGDRLDGAVVAAIGKDSVQLDGRHDTILRLPD